MTKRPKRDPEHAVVEAGARLHEAIDEAEALTRRMVKSELPDRDALVRAGQVLQKAANAHQAFLTHLEALSAAVGTLRERQNASATVLTSEAARVDARRIEHEGFEARFAALGTAARAITERLAGIDPTETASHVDAVATSLGEAADDAATLQADLKAAGLTELEQKAHALRQQLKSLHGKLRGFGSNGTSSAPPSDDPER